MDFTGQIDTPWLLPWGWLLPRNSTSLSILTDCYRKQAAVTLLLTWAHRQQQRSQLH